MILRHTILPAVVVLGCSTMQPPLGASHAEGVGKSANDIQKLTLEKDSVRITVAYVTPRAVMYQQISPKRISKKDFEPILKDEYVNYAEGNNSDLLTLYNVYKEYQADQIRDYWGNSLFPEFTLSPMFDDNFKPRFTVFDIQIENLRNDKIRLDPFSSILVTDDKNQISTLTKDDLKVELDMYWARFSLTPFALGSSAFSREYVDHHIQIFQRMVLSSGTVYPGAKVRGLLFFPRLRSETKSFTFILPDVGMTRHNLLVRAVDFEIDFLKQ